MKNIKKSLISIILVVSMLISAGCGATNTQTEEKYRDAYTGGVHDFTAPDIAGEYLVQNGRTEYVLVVPHDADSIMQNAASEFKQFFKQATGIDILSIKDNVNDSRLTDSNAKRISLGETSVYKNLSESEKESLSYDKKVLGSDGVRIVTKDNTVFLLGGGSNGVLYSVYDFMNICFNYEFYYRNCWYIDTGVINLPMKQFDVTDIPDVAIRNYGNNISVFNDAWNFELESGLFTQNDARRCMDRYRYINNANIFLPIYKEYGSTDNFNYGFHNVDYFVYDGCTDENGNVIWRTSWQSDKGAPAGRGAELCYSAHGNEEDLEALVVACANKIINSLKMPHLNSRTMVGFTILDGGYQCDCETCQALYAQDGNSYAGQQIRVANRIMEKIEQWKNAEGNEAYRDRELTMFIFAYGPSEAPPVIYDESKDSYVAVSEDVICRDDVAVFLCNPVSEISRYWSKELDQDVANRWSYVEKWRACSAHMYNWLYQQRFLNYSSYTDSINTLNGDLFAWLLNNGSSFMMNQGDWQGENITSFGAMNEYVFSKLMWNCTLNIEDLVKDFFAHMYCDAADTMYDIFTTMRNHSMTVAQMPGGKAGERADKAEMYPYRSYLRPLLQKFEQALEEIEVLKTTAPAEYELVKKRIETEYVGPLYLTLAYYGNSSAMPFTSAEKLAYKTRLVEITEAMGFRIAELDETPSDGMHDFAINI